ncbi:hypothetical protein HNP84_008587 [Thermocatellispora tengchongensis]|uniref:Uncharacterized protein n=1 Tax=Thermocatellispora tengchongensis TaxID=1073253 RepID=A0A840PIM4_9ACTN|nr:hypothetical protein [Thermocatellispora tengchongensis]MBB5138829.1 hypothetical protein [Thermocatellispora tengchongensis]
MWRRPQPAYPEGIPTGRQRGVRPDELVWPLPPPRTDDDEGSSTQPFPAIPAAGPLPRPAAPAEPQQSAAEDTAQEEPPRRRRTVLLVIGAVVALALALAVPAFDRYLVYKEGGNRDDIVHVVEPGQSVAVKHVRWQAKVERAKPGEAPEPLSPDRVYLKITATRVALDHEGLLRSGDPTFEMQDAQGRTWKAMIVDHNLPLYTEENKIGTPYQYTVLSLVPADVADEVELWLRPSIFRRDQPVEDLGKTTGEFPDHVLRFKR